MDTRNQLLQPWIADITRPIAQIRGLDLAEPQWREHSVKAERYEYSPVPAD
jgi:hypothetical protein